MNLSELSPYPVFIDWEGQAIKLKPFDLRAITWAERFFFKDGQNGFERMNHILSNPDDQNLIFNTLIDIVYYLGSENFKRIGILSAVELKKTFGGQYMYNLEQTIETATNYLHESTLDESTTELMENAIIYAIRVLNTRINRVEKLGEFKDAVEQSFESAFPPQKKQRKRTGGDLYEKLFRIRNKKEQSNSSKWDQIYTSFYMSGGISLEDFFGFTMKQIEILLPEISYEIEKNYERQVEIHGRKLTSKVRRQEPEMEFTEEDVSRFEQIHQKLNARRKIS